jgi:hypothetical protein
VLARARRLCGEPRWPWWLHPEPQCPRAHAVSPGGCTARALVSVHEPQCPHAHKPNGGKFDIRTHWSSLVPHVRAGLRSFICEAVCISVVWKKKQLQTTYKSGGKATPNRALLSSYISRATYSGPMQNFSSGYLACGSEKCRGFLCLKRGQNVPSIEVITCHI